MLQNIKIIKQLDIQGAISSYHALDTVSDKTILYYQYLGDPVNNTTDIASVNIPTILNVKHVSGTTHVTTVLNTERHALKHRLDSSQLESFLLDTAQALEDAYNVGVIHGDIRPKRIFVQDSKYLIEGYGVRWELVASRYMPSEKYQSLAGDVYSWAKTVGAFIPFNMPRALVNLLERCLEKNPQDRPTPTIIVNELQTFFSEAPQNPTLIDLDCDSQTEILTHTQERFIRAIDILKAANKKTFVKTSTRTKILSKPEKSASTTSDSLKHGVEAENLVQRQEQFSKAMKILKETN